MDTKKANKSLMLFLGITLLTQAITSLVGGSIFMSPFESSNITSELMINIAEGVSTGYISIFLQMVTAVVIILLAVAMFKIARHKGKTFAIVALCMYVFEAILLAVAQGFVFGLIEISKLYAETSNADLLLLVNILSSIEDFICKMAMIPFGIGAVIFYWLITKAQVIPKWLGCYGIATVPFVLIATPLMAFGVGIPFWILIPYVPFEFFTGGFVIVKAINLKREND